MVVGRGGGARFLQALPGPVLGHVLLAARAHVDARPARQGLQRPPEVEAAGLHEEAEGVAAGPAAEAVVRAVVRVDHEGRGLLGVERAQALEVAPRPRQAHLLPNDILDGEPVLYLGYDVVIWHKLGGGWRLLDI